MNKKSVLIMVLAMMLVCMISVAGTIAWLSAESDPVVNTFTVGNIQIDLEEHEYLTEDSTANGNKLDYTVDPVKSNDDYKMIPGLTMPKDPFVTVEKGSEPCWVFIKITKNDTYDTYLENYKVADTWEHVETDDLVSVYRYKTVVKAMTAEVTDIWVLGDDSYGAENTTGEVTVRTDVSKAALEAVTKDPSIAPTLTFKAYAIQSANLPADSTPQSIWNLVELEEAEANANTGDENTGA